LSNIFFPVENICQTKNGAIPLSPEVGLLKGEVVNCSSEGHS
jgi:hypothetical protein